MANPSNKNLQTEVDACFLYNKLAEAEQDVTVANVFRQMSAIEKSHAEAILKKMNPDSMAAFPPPSIRAKTLNTIGKVLGYDYVLGVLMDTEKSISNAVINAKNKLPITGGETNHVKILRSLLENESKVTGSNVAKFESRHRSVGGNALRAAVLGGNDGLVSNLSLVMGIAGATAGGSGVIGSAAGLFLIGSAITLFTGKSIWFSGFRQVIFGLIAAAITFGIGKLIGVSLAG